MCAGVALVSTDGATCRIVSPQSTPWMPLGNLTEIAVSGKNTSTGYKMTLMSVFWNPCFKKKHQFEKKIQGGKLKGLKNRIVLFVSPFQKVILIFLETGGWKLGDQTLRSYTMQETEFQPGDVLWSQLSGSRGCLPVTVAFPAWRFICVHPVCLKSRTALHFGLQLGRSLFFCGWDAIKFPGWYELSKS